MVEILTFSRRFFGARNIEHPTSNFQRGSALRSQFEVQHWAFEFLVRVVVLVLVIGNGGIENEDEEEDEDDLVPAASG